MSRMPVRHVSKATRGLTTMSRGGPWAGRFRPGVGTSAAGVGVMLILGLTALPAPAAPQAVRAGEEVCAEGTARGWLGISGLDCRGDCTLTMNEKGEERSWSFSVEPTITGIDRRGPAYGALQAGDALVAVDGMLITTAEGGRRYASIMPGENVRIRFRRDGRVHEVTLRAEPSCEPVVPAPPASVEVIVPGIARAASPPRPGKAGEAPAVTVAPRVVVTSTADVASGVSISTTAVTSTDATGVSSTTVTGSTEPRGRLGIAMSCDDCGTMRDQETGRPSWFFSGPIEVTGVDAGGPADDVGIQIGDLITAINGHAMETEAGGRAFSDLEPGKAVRLTVVKRNGSRTGLTVVPDEPQALTSVVVTAAPATSARKSVVVSEPRAAAPPAAPDAVVSTQPSGLASPPKGLPLRYSGAVSGVELEVRGEPVTVTQMSDAGIILINSDGLWIRIRIPGKEREP